MEELNFIQEYQRAWATFFDGRPTAELDMWGTSLLWWGRIGKLIGLLGAATVIADIVGAERIRQFGNSLSAAIDLRRSRIVLETAFAFFRFLPELIGGVVIVMTQRRRKREAVSEALQLLKHPFAWLFLYPIYIGIAGGSWYFHTLWVGWWPWVVGGLVGMYPGMLIAPLTVVTFALMASVILGVINVSLEMVAKLLDRDTIGAWIKVIGIILIFVGVQFDMLAS